MKITEYLLDALNGRNALAAFNAPSFDVMLAISQASADLERPVIIQTSSKLVAQLGAPMLKGWFDLARKETGADSILHLDHCRDFKIINSCIDSGWDMVMYDGSSLPISTNCSELSKVVEMAHLKNVAVEGEVGCIGGEEDGIEATSNYASDEEIKQLSHETDIDCIAVGFGNVHGDYKTKSNLKWDIFESSRDISKLPLVLHGGSGLSDDEFCRAIKAGAAKINISTDLKKAYQNIVSQPGLSDFVLKNPFYLHDQIINECKAIAFRYIKLFSSPNF